ncbi:cache domain-containing protein [Paenibacillus sp. TAB 01]|uniref:cache domain-containing protein n=1 Tax=Paenibacillus sp. TAB 01 TaxID=3368988 RepID=UPI0037526C30
MKDAKRKSQFGKMLLSYLLTVILPVVIISSLYYVHMAVEKKQELQKQASADLDALYVQTKMAKDNIDNLALQLALTPDLNAKLTNPFEADMYDFSVLKEHLKSQISASPLIYSMYVYFKLNDKVLTTREGFYPRSEFFDKDLLERILQRGEGQSDYEVRLLQSSMDPSLEVISFNRPLPVTSKETLGQLVLNVRKDVFFGMVERLADTQLNGITILRSDSGEVVYGSGTPALLEGISPDSMTGSRIVTDHGEEQFLTYVKSRFNSWVFVKSTPFSEYQQAMAGIRSAILRTAVVVLIIGFVMSYLISIFMYGPWKQMIREHEEIKRTMERTKPIVKHRLIYDMLNNYITEPNQIRDHLQQVGVHFPFSHYTVLLVAPFYKGAQEAEHEPNLLAFSFVENALSKAMPIAGTLFGPWPVRLHSESGARRAGGDPAAGAGSWAA